MALGLLDVVVSAARYRISPIGRRPILTFRLHRLLPTPSTSHRDLSLPLPTADMILRRSLLRVRPGAIPTPTCTRSPRA